MINEKIIIILKINNKKINNNNSLINNKIKKKVAPVIEGLIVRQHELLVVPLNAVPELPVRNAVAALHPPKLLHLLVEALPL